MFFRCQALRVASRAERGLKLDEGLGALHGIRLSIHQAIVCLQP